MAKRARSKRIKLRRGGPNDPKQPIGTTGVEGEETLNIIGTNPRTALGSRLHTLDPASAKAFQRKQPIFSPMHGNVSFAEFEDDFNTPGFGKRFGADKKLVKEFKTPQGLFRSIQQQNRGKINRLAEFHGDKLPPRFGQETINESVIATEESLGSTFPSFKSRMQTAKTPEQFADGGPLLPSNRIGHFGRGGDIALGTAKGALSGAAAGTAAFPGVGTVIGGIIGGLGGLFGANKKAKAEEEAAAEEAKNKKDTLAMNNLALDKSALAVFPTKGVETAPFGLKEGGPAPATFRALHGGNLKPLSNGVMLAKGRSHAQGGIKGDTNFDGLTDVEIEDGELFFPDVGDSGFVVNEKISRKFIPQFRRIKGNSKTDISTRNLLISRAVNENENRRAKIGELI